MPRRSRLPGLIVCEMRQASSIWNAGERIDLITFTQVLRDRQLLDGRRAIFRHEPFKLIQTAQISKCQLLERYLEGQRVIFSWKVSK